MWPLISMITSSSWFLKVINIYLLTRRNLIEAYLLPKQAASGHSPQNHHGPPYVAVFFQEICIMCFDQS